MNKNNNMQCNPSTCTRDNIYNWKFRKYAILEEKSICDVVRTGIEANSDAEKGWPSRSIMIKYITDKHLE